MDSSAVHLASSEPTKGRGTLGGMRSSPAGSLGSCV